MRGKFGADVPNYSIKKGREFRKLNDRIAPKGVVQVLVFDLW
jgi:hypothetical protein